MTSSSYSNNRLDAILEAVDAAIITINQSGVIVDCNAATVRMFGFDRDSLLKQNVSILMPEPTKGEHDQYLKNHIHTGVNRIIGTGRKVTGRHQSGRVFPLHLSVAKYKEDDHLFFTGILHDLTELDSAYSVGSRLGVIVEESANEIMTFHIDTLHFTSANRVAYKNLGYTEAQLCQLTPVDLFQELGLDSLKRTIEPLISGERQRADLTTGVRRADQSLYQADVSLHMTSAFDPPEMVAIAQDVTEKNRLLESIHRNQRIESLGNLTGGIAHDFNNILTVIMGNLELLDIEVDDAESLELVSDATEAAKMGARLTKRLLAFARRSPLTPQKVNVTTLVGSLSEMLSRTLGNSVALQVSLADNLWFTNIDISELENALVNLAINARDAMPDGGRLVIETENCFLDDEAVLGNDARAGDYVKISVADTGSGIPDEIKHAIFEPFVSSKKGKGSGLGLSMVYGFVVQSGGFITVYSDPAQGTMFSLYLPRSHQSAEPEIQHDETHYSRPVNKTILVAEDEDNVRKVVVKRLKKLGYTVVEAQNGYDAIELYKRTPVVDLVFSDVSMTEGMTGYDLAQAIRELNPTQPVLLTSGYAEDVLSADKLRDSGLTLLRKPYNLPELEAQLAKVLTWSRIV